MTVFILSMMLFITLIHIYTQLRVGYLEKKVQEIQLLTYWLKVHVKKKETVDPEECDRINQEILKKW